MIQIEHTIKLTGITEEDYAGIEAHLDQLHDLHPEWNLVKDPILNSVTAIKTEEVEQL